MTAHLLEKQTEQRRIKADDGSGLRVRDVMTRRVIRIDETDSLALAAQVMLWNGIRHLPVTRRGWLAGMVSEHDVYRHRAEDGDPRPLDMAVGDVMSTPPLEIGPDAPLDDAAARMVSHGVSCLPVTVDGEIIGIVTTTDLLALTARKAVEPTARTVGEIMTPDPIRATVGEPLLTAMGRMLGHGIRHLPVVDREGRVAGLLSERDLRNAIGVAAWSFSGDTAEELRRSPVEEAMSAAPALVASDAPLSRVASVLMDERQGAVLVVDAAERLIGIVSYLDVFRTLEP